MAVAVTLESLPRKADASPKQYLSSVQCCEAARAFHEARFRTPAAHRLNLAHELFKKVVSEAKDLINRCSAECHTIGVLESNLAGWCRISGESSSKFNIRYGKKNHAVEWVSLPFDIVAGPFLMLGEFVKSGFVRMFRKDTGACFLQYCWNRLQGRTPELITKGITTAAHSRDEAVGRVQSHASGIMVKMYSIHQAVTSLQRVCDVDGTRCVDSLEAIFRKKDRFLRKVKEISTHRDGRKCFQEALDYLDDAVEEVSRTLKETTLPDTEVQQALEKAASEAEKLEKNLLDSQSVLRASTKDILISLRCICHELSKFSEMERNFGGSYVAPHETYCEMLNNLHDQHFDALAQRPFEELQDLYGSFQQRDPLGLTFATRYRFFQIVHMLGVLNDEPAERREVYSEQMAVNLISRKQAESRLVAAMLDSLGLNAGVIEKIRGMANTFQIIGKLKVLSEQMEASHFTKVINDDPSLVTSASDKTAEYVDKYKRLVALGREVDAERILANHPRLWGIGALRFSAIDASLHVWEDMKEAQELIYRMAPKYSTQAWTNVLEGYQRISGIDGDMNQNFCWETLAKTIAEVEIESSCRGIEHAVVFRHLAELLLCSHPSRMPREGRCASKKLQHPIRARAFESRVDGSHRILFNHNKSLGVFDLLVCDPH